jgi:hypothetical protein
MRLSAATTLLLLAAYLSPGQEAWFEADSYFVKADQSTALRLFAGEALKKERELPFQASKTRSFEMYSPSGPFDMRTMAEEGHLPIVSFSANTPGTFSLLMETEWTYTKVPAAAFEAYLRERGMEDVIAERTRLKESGSEARVRSSGFIKSLIQVGDNLTGNAKFRVGRKLEIVPLENPFSRAVGKQASFQIWFDGRPLSAHPVFADNRDENGFATKNLTTDKEGVVNVRLDRKGVWLVRLVYMQRCERFCGGADWESFWAAFSFGVK